MKKKGLLIIAALVCVLTAGATVAYAAWSATLKSAKNTVTVDNPLQISIGGTAMSGTIRPGDTTGVSATFSVDVDDQGADTYKLVITDIEFKKDDGSDAWSSVAGSGVWKYKVDDGSWTAISENAVIAATAATGNVTLTVTVEDTLPESYAGYSLSFYAELVKNAAA
jgi:hypothetical protein